MSAATDAWTSWSRGELRAALGAASVVVLTGGTSSEREVSQVSGRAMADALRAVAPGEPPIPGTVVEVEIEAGGRWRVGDAWLAPQRAVDALPADAIYLIGLHGGEGEDGRLQGFLEVSGRRYTGAGAAASAVCMRKAVSRAVFEAAGLRTAPGRTIVGAEWAAARESIVAELVSLGAAPWYVKPESGGSSVLTFRATTREEVVTGVDRVLASEPAALVEVGIAGLEVTCGVIGNTGNTWGRETVLPLVEIIPKEGRFFDYDEKYSESGAVEICPPQRTDEATQRHVQELSLAAYRATGCTGYARVDFILPEDGGEPVILEANTLPGFTPTSLLPKAAAATGVDFRGLCLELCALAIERFGRDS